MRFSLRQLLVSLTLVSLVLGVCLWYLRWPQVEVLPPEIARKKRLVLTTRNEANDVFGLNLRIKGHLNGSAALILPWDSQRLSIGPGNFSRHVSHDFYDNRAVIQYLPGTASKGSLVVEYRFW
jgi:hypothetical protein